MTTKRESHQKTAEREETLPAASSDGVAASRKEERGAVRTEIKPLDPQPCKGDSVSVCEGSVYYSRNGRTQGDVRIPKPGDRVPVREEWAISLVYGPTMLAAGLRKAGVKYGDGVVRLCEVPSEEAMEQASRWFDECSDEAELRPASEMPDWAVRQWNVVKSVRVCQVRDVTEEEAEAAGYQATYTPPYVAGGEICGPDGEYATDAMASELKLTPESWVSVVTYEDQGTTP